MYNYIWVRRPDTGNWVEAHHFGVDVRVRRQWSRLMNWPGGIINAVEMCMDIRCKGNQAIVAYGNPLIQYRQFDDKVGSPETVRKYPDFTRSELPSLVDADAELEFVLRLDPRFCQ